jgi:superfamily II DNA or RNA helicase
LNPWSTVPVAVASIDYTKRPDVLRSVASCQWDVLAIDEAHGAGPDSERRTVVAALADRAPYVLLLTATPHSGERRAFQALCQTGSHGDALLVFRRTRADVALGTNRRVHRLQVRPSDAEARMHELLQEFTRAVQAERGFDDVWLALSVLHKRALSSAGSLAQSVERRVSSLGASEKAAGHSQLVLPLDTDGEYDSADAAPAWATNLALNDVERERHLLRALAEAARNAARHETKFSAILRLLRRVDEPVVIFTEYRDTLLHLRDALRRPVCILHGGLSRDERTSALRDFLNSRRQILLATDAAGEGLNLHQRCRIVINLELPWNPMRLEQRIGRVDRIGQRRTIHVFHLIARASGEGRILDRLESRIARAREDINVPNPLTDERSLSQFVMQETGHDKSASAEFDEPASNTAGRLAIRLDREAASEAERLAFARRLWDDRDKAVQASLEVTGTWITRARLRRTRQHLGSRAIALLRVEHEDGHGRVCDWTLLPVAIPLGPSRHGTGVRNLRTLLRDVTAALQAKAQDACAGRLGDTERLWKALIDTRLARERAIALAVLNAPRTPLQAGLFDRRAEFEYVADRAALDESARDSARRIDAWRRAAVLIARPARLLLVLAP